MIKANRLVWTVARLFGSWELVQEWLIMPARWPSVPEKFKPDCWIEIEVI